MVNLRAIMPTRAAACVAAAFFVALASPALAQINFITPNSAVDATGQQVMCQNASGQAVACGPTATLPTTSSSQFPLNSTPITGNGTGTTGAVVGTLAGTTGKTTSICGFDVSALGGTAAIGPVTVAGLVGSSMVFQLSSTAAGATLPITFSPCIPASATNTAITVTTTADGTASAVDVNTWGFQQ